MLFRSELLKENKDKIDWFRLSGNINAIELIEENINKINFEILSINQNPKVIKLIEKHYIKYWNTGVHYFYPLGNRDIKKTLTYLANPAENIQVVGELISLKQGWVEGAIESVDRILSMY